MQTPCNGGVSRAADAGGCGGQVSSPFQEQLADTPKRSVQGPGGESGNEIHNVLLQRGKRRVHVEVSRGLALWGLQCGAVCRPLPQPLPHRQSLPALVLSHPATWPLRKAVVLSKEGAQLSLRPLCFQFCLPLIFPWKAGLVKCMRAAFWENHCSFKSPLDHSLNWPRLLSSQLPLHSHYLRCFFHS